jgi:hypothetical protein
MKPSEWLVVAGRFAMVALGLAATVATVVVISGERRRPRWSEVIPEPADWAARWSRVRVGMTREQILGVLGPPILVARHAGLEACTQEYHYPDYSSALPTRRICFDSRGRLAWLHSRGMRFDLRSMVDGAGLREEVPILAAAALVMGVLLGLATVAGRRSRERVAILGSKR